jgi:hypothetical protein
MYANLKSAAMVQLWQPPAIFIPAVRDRYVRPGEPAGRDQPAGWASVSAGTDSPGVGRHADW